MKRQNYIAIFFFVIFSCVLVSCQASMTPLEVCESFWLGIKTKNNALIKKYSLSGSIDEPESPNDLPEVSAYHFGKILIDGDIAEIETKITLLIEEKSLDMSIQTYLIKENEDWKVNYEQTMLPLTINQEMTELFGGIQELTKEFTEEVEDSVEEFKEKAIPEIKSKLEEAEQELREKLPEIKGMIDEFLQELEKSIEESLPAEEEPKTQQT